MSVNIAIVGVSGLAGGEIYRYLKAHPQVEITTLQAKSTAGQQLCEVHPQLVADSNPTILPVDIPRLAECDTVFMALPHGLSAEIAEKLLALNQDTRIIDVGADYRLVSESDWRTFYGGKWAGSWCYGLPELMQTTEREPKAQAAEISQARTVALPGCNVTAVTLAVQPALASGLISPQVVATLAVGYSGAGKALKPHLLATNALSNANPYSVGGVHRHIPEIAQNLYTVAAQDVSVVLTPVLVPMNRGILATVTAPLLNREKLREAYEVAYANTPMVKLLPEGVWPETASVQGTGMAHIQIVADRQSDTAIMVAAIDNLGKGTAANALESFNLMHGWEIDTAIPKVGVK